MIKSICIVRLSALGDVLMLVPLIRTLQTFVPEAKLTWVISRPAYDLVEGLDGVEFIVINKPTGLRDYWQFAKRMKPYDFDVLLATQASFRANLLYSLIRAKRKIGYDAIRAKDGHGWFVHETIEPGHDHTLDGFLKFAQAVGIHETVIRWDLSISDSDRAFAAQHLPTRGKHPVLLINPAASKPERSWLVERYIEVIQHVQLRWGAEVVLTGGPGAADQALGRSIEQAVSVTNLIAKTRPKQLLAVIQQASLLLCPDTGPSHMAAAVGTPVIALHAVTSSKVSGPYPFQDLAVDFYHEAVCKLLNQTLADTPWGTHVHGQETMKLISVDAVIQRLDDFFSQSPTGKSDHNPSAG